MATGFTTTEGKAVLLERALNDVDTDRTGYEIGLFTNDAGLTESSILSDVTALTGTSYAALALAYGSWTVASLGAGLGYKVSFAKQDFTPSGETWTGITGAYIYTTGVSQKLVHVCYSGLESTVESTQPYSVTPVISLPSGTNSTIQYDKTPFNRGYILVDYT